MIRFSDAVTHEKLVLFSAVMLAFVACGAVPLRRHLFRNAFDRRAYGLLLLATVGMVAGRLVALRYRTRIEASLVGNLLVFAVVAAAGALTLIRWLWVVAILFVIGAAALLVSREHHLALFAVFTSAPMAVAAYFLWRQSRTRRN